MRHLPLHSHFIAPFALLSLALHNTFAEPVANDDYYEVRVNETLSIPAADGLLLNDYHTAGETLTVLAVDDGLSHGTLELQGDGSFQYTPSPEFTGLDRFTYEAVDPDGGRAESIVRLAVGNEQWNPRFHRGGVDNMLSFATVGPNNELYVGGQTKGWSPLNGPRQPRGVAQWKNGQWVPLGRDSNNGVNGVAYAGLWFNDEFYVGGAFNMAGGIPSGPVARWDGQQWHRAGIGLSGTVTALAASEGVLYAAGRFQADGARRYQVRKLSNEEWIPMGESFNSEPLALCITHTGALLVGGWFTTIGATTAKHLAVWNGVAWEEFNGGTDGTVKAISSAGERIYVGGGFSTIGSIAAEKIAVWEGAQWSALGDGAPADYIASILVIDDEVYAGGEARTETENPSTAVYRWQGQTWETLPILSGPGYPRVLALAIHRGLLLAAGVFQDADGTQVDQIAAWDGSSWQPFHNGIDAGLVYASTIWNEHLAVGGDFKSAGGVKVSGVAVWDGNEWSAIGNADNGPNGPVHALAATEAGDLLVGGDFTRTGDVEARGLALWNGESWRSAPKRGLDGPVYALAIGSSGEIYCGGKFTTAGFIPAKNVAVLKGDQWSALGGGLDEQVQALVYSGLHLYAAGAFRFANGIRVNCVARWDGKEWEPLAEGVGSSTRAIGHSLAVRGSEIFLGGDFAMDGEGGAVDLARWDGNRWFAVPGEFIEFGGIPAIFSLATVGADLYAGGRFSMVDGVLTGGVARWDGAQWHALGSGTYGDNQVRTIANSENKLFIGGHFNGAGAIQSPRLAQWDLQDVPPEVAISGISNGTVVVTGSDIQLSATVESTDEENTVVEFFANGTLLGSDEQPPFELAWPSVIAGDYLVHATAMLEGVTGFSAPLNLKVIPPEDNVSPQIQVVAPQSNTRHTSGDPVRFNIEAEDTDGAIAEIRLFEGENLLHVLQSPPYTFLWITNVSSDYTFRATAMDNVGASTTSEPILIYLQEPPTVTLRSPSEGDIFIEPEFIDLSAFAVDKEAPVVSVEFLTNGVFLAKGVSNTSADFKYRWTNVALGTYTILAAATDSDGAITTSSPVTISVKEPNVPPVVSILAPEPDSVHVAPTAIQIAAQADDPDGEIVEVSCYWGKEDDTPRGTTGLAPLFIGTLTEPPYVFVLRNLTEGRYCFQARATDTRGSTAASSKVCVTVTTDSSRVPKYELVPLGTLGGLHSTAIDINNNSEVVGSAETEDRSSHPFHYRSNVMVDLGSFKTGLGDSGGAWGISDSGDIVGGSHSSSGGDHAFRYADSGFIDLGSLGGPVSIANSVNSAGDIVGFAMTPDRERHAFLYRDGQMNQLPLNDLNSEALDVNQHGQIVGVGKWPGQGVRGFRFVEPDKVEILPTLGGDYTTATAINAAGQITGAARNSIGKIRAFFYENGLMSDLGTLGGYESWGRDISRHGQIVGRSKTEFGEDRAFLWHSCVMYDLNQLIATNDQWTLHEATAINDLGEIVGSGTFREGTRTYKRAYLLRPAPDSPIKASDSFRLRLAESQFKTCLPVPVGLPFVIERSDDLQSWTAIQTNYNRTGFVDFTDPTAVNAERRFYRLTPLEQH